MDIDYYNKLRELKNIGRISARILIAPPRTGSTMLGVALTDDHYCHEPFLRFGYSEHSPNPSYQNIYESIGGAKFEAFGSSTTVVIKELSHRIALRDEYIRLMELSDYPPIFLIRNPLLTAESRIKKIIETIPQKARESTIQWLVEQTGEKFTEKSIESQQRLLDIYSKGMGFLDWSKFTSECINNQNYVPLEGILLSNLDRLAIDLSEDGSLGWQVDQLVQNGKNVMLVDSTELRLDPEGIMKKVCEEWKIGYGEQRINWGERKLELGRGTEKIDDLVWYDSLSKSVRIEPPTEVPPKLGGLPSFVRSDIASSGLPQYIRLFNNRGRIHGDLAQINRDLSEEGKLVYTIADIDPVFAILANPALLQDQEYLAKHEGYSEAIRIIRDNIPGGEGGFDRRRI